MSETGDSPDPATDEVGPDTDVENSMDAVLDALEPLMDRMDDHRGFSVKFAPKRGVGRVTRDVVEVRFRLPQRHPSERDHARGMLQDAGFAPVSGRRGGESGVCLYLAVPLSEDAEPAVGRRKTDSGQGTL